MPGLPAAGDSSLVVVSNRGPVELRRSDDGTIETGRASGGLASSLAAMLSGSGATWIYAAISDVDRECAGQEVPEFQGMNLLPQVMDKPTFTLAYELISNSILWFVYHDLFDRIRNPSHGVDETAGWDAYREVNRLFAQAVADNAEQGATVLVQDYHLHMVGRFLAVMRPDVTCVHFVHTPFCEPSGLAVIPDAWAHELLESMSHYRSVGFHCARWEEAFLRCCSTYGVDPPATFVSPLGVDPAPLEEVRQSAECQRELDRFGALLGERKVIVRVDRVEPSKNLLRGFLAYDRILDSRDVHDKVVFLALAYPSRESLPAYRDYRDEVEKIVFDINARHGTPDWTPIHLEVKDYFPRSIAALSRYDVLLVNPVKDGLNLVAKEGPIVNEHDGVVVLSRSAGVWDELSGSALGVNPFDLNETARVMEAALAMDPESRKLTASELRDASVAHSPEDWLRDQLTAAR